MKTKSIAIAMFEFQPGREAPDEDKEAIVAFIKTLAREPVHKNYHFDLASPETDASQEMAVADGSQEPVGAIQKISQNERAQPLRSVR